MKKLFLSALACALLLSSCKENHSMVNLSISVPPADTNYLATAELPQTQNVLAEEFTGASCPNCPEGHEILASYKLQYGAIFHVIGIHPNDPNLQQANPMPNHQYDFRTDIGMNIGTSVYGGGLYLPSGGIDRTPYSGSTLLNRLQWGGAIEARVADNSSPVNLTVSSSYNPATDTIATITATIKYVKTVAAGQNLSIAIVEDSLLDNQDSIGITLQNYVFNNVFRDMVTASNPTVGDQLLTSMTTIDAGRVNVRRYYYKVNQGVPNGNNKLHTVQHCRVIAFVTDKNTKKVLQSAECPLVQ